MEEKPKYYDGTKLLSMKDINGNTPEIYIVTSNNTAGKTTYFNRYCVNRFLKHGEKFMLLYRWKYELDDCAESFFKTIGPLFFPGYSMESEKESNGMFVRLILNEPGETPESEPIPIECGYAVTLSGADSVKKKSHYFNDTARILFDEFQPMGGRYVPREVEKFQTIHVAVARGEGKQTRYCPVIMMGNPYSIVNPYYVSMGITDRINKNTKFLRGAGYVLEQGYNESASKALKQSGFMQAFDSTHFLDYAADAKYLDDNENFIQKMPETGRYLCTFKYNDREYSVKEYLQEGILYVSDSIDKSYPIRLTINVGDHDLNYLLLSKHEIALRQYKDFFDHGCVRFKNQLCKTAFLSLISYNVM